jgi:K(+)-stimulated pyrophosphate-energized sodium pump
MEGSLGTLNITSYEWLSLWLVLGSALVALIYGAFLAFRILQRDQGSEKMISIAKAIQTGAGAYLRRQFTTIGLFVVVITVVLFVTASSTQIAIGRSLAFLMGSIFSGLTGFIGMSLAVRGNVRTAAAAKSSLKDSLAIAFRTGTIAGMLTIGLGLLGATIIFMVYQSEAPQVLVGYGFGAALLALFMRVGGGIFTKAADVGADLVGKVEKGIPEDDPRNAAVIADNVGDNVGDCAGMAADLFESYEVTLIASMILGFVAFPSNPTVGVIFPLFVMAAGAVASIFGTLAVRSRSETENPMAAINRGFLVSVILSIAMLYFISSYYVEDLRVFWATTSGLVLALAISLITEHYTSSKRNPVQEIARSSKSGAATTILSGFAIGEESSVWAVLAISAAIIAAIIISGGEESFVLYAVSLIGMGMLTSTGIIVSMDTYGPVADNAQGISEMTGESNEKAQAIMNKLDAVGNTTKATTKGFAIASAVIAAVSLFGSFMSAVGAGQIASIKINNPVVFVGLLIGGAVPFLFTSLTIRAVGRGAAAVVEEVRRQFREIVGIMEFKNPPDYARVTDICTKTALRELVAPGLLAVLSPVIIGFAIGAESLGGFLAGAIVSGQLLAVLMANAGGAWDNAKKWIEDGNLGGKGSEPHRATVIGDTVGDPFKDTSGPAIDPLIKVMNLVSLLIAPLLIGAAKLTWQNALVVGLSVVILGVAVWLSKRETGLIESNSSSKESKEQVVLQES